MALANMQEEDGNGNHRPAAAGILSVVLLRESFSILFIPQVVNCRRTHRTSLSRALKCLKIGKIRSRGKMTVVIKEPAQ